MELWFACSEHLYSLAPGLLILEKHAPTDAVQRGSPVQVIEAMVCGTKKVSQ